MHYVLIMRGMRVWHDFGYYQDELLIVTVNGKATFNYSIAPYFYNYGTCAKRLNDF